MTINMREHFVQSNLIEDIKDIHELPKSEKAWDYINKINTLTKNDILNVHAIIMEDLLWDDRYVGNYRDVNVTVGGRTCPPHYIVPQLMDVWIGNMRFWQDIDPMNCHVQFEHIHPFVDGNGRTGRMLMWWHEVKQDKEPTLITYNKRWDYYALFDKRAI